LDGPTLVIAEKPSTARSIAKALASISGDKPVHKKRANVTYHEVYVRGKLHIISPAAGHLYGIGQISKGWTYPVFDIEWKPAWQIGKSSGYTKPYLDNFIELAVKCTSFISATDYDREGSVIAANILLHACGTENASRMKFSTLTTVDLVRSYESAASELDFGQINAGRTRHVLDWYWGVNITRALTLAMKPHIQGFGVISSGRVQGPTLKILADRERLIESFVPENYWTLELICQHEGVEFSATSDPERIFDEQKADQILEKCSGKPAIVAESNRKVSVVPPGSPFDLTTLQTEAYRHFGFSPSRTMSIAQFLYERALISYPRTSSQQLPPSIGYEMILQDLAQQPKYSDLANNILALPDLKPRQGKKTDPAHPSIFPTGKTPGKLRPDQDKLYDLICRRFMATFAPDATREFLDVVLEVGGNPFRTTGKRILEANWMDVYGPYAKFKENLLPHLDVGEGVEVLDLVKLDKQTQPPKRFTQASIVREMEKRSLGTKATRAGIVQTLYDRGYVRGKSIEVSELGLSVVETLDKYCPGVLSESMTTRFEGEMEAVEAGKKDKEEVTREATDTLSEILGDFKKNEEGIGKALAEASMKTKARDREIGPCPSCGETLRFITSRRTGKRFIGCSGYSKGCRYSAPVPQSGRLSVTRNKCKGCGQPIIGVYKAGKRPWTFCFNLECPLREEKEEKTDGTRGEDQGKQA
jgi:DNA topoisomerase-1